MRIQAFLFIMLYLVSACGTASSHTTPVLTATHEPEPTITQHEQVDKSVINNSITQQILQQLAQNKVTVQLPERSRAAFLDPAPGVVYPLEKGWLHVHLFSNEQAANERAKQIPQEMRKSAINWVAPPHFFQCKSVIVLYLGRSKVVTDILAEQCGAPFVE